MKTDQKNNVPEETSSEVSSKSELEVKIGELKSDITIEKAVSNVV